jgi:hypothetical protein
VKLEQQPKLITAILPKGHGGPLVQKLKDEKGVVTANAGHARGVGRMTPMKYRGVGEQSEKDIVTVVVSREASDDIFEFIYRDQEIDTPHAGILYVSDLGMASLFELPADLEEEK